MFRAVAASCISLVAISAAETVEAKIPEDFHGLLYTCGRHPTVQVSGKVAYAYEADLTRYTEGKAVLRSNAVTVTFPGKYGTFTIEMRGGRFFSHGALCRADPV